MSKPPFYKRKKFWKRFVILAILLPIVLFFAVVGVAYWKQKEIVQHLIEDVNEDFEGLIEIEGSHISPFETFPYISIDLEHVQIFENKQKTTRPLVDVNEVFLGFDLWTIITGNMEIKDIKLKNGNLNLVQHENGEFNITKALTSKKEIESANEEFHLDLHEIELENIDIIKLNEANNLLVEAFINDADMIFNTSPDHVYTSLDSRFELNIIVEGDTTFIKHKHFDVDTELDYLVKKDMLHIQPTKVKLEGTDFNMEGDVNLLEDGLLDLHFDGNKENFKLVMAMAPEEIIPILERYDNQGKIFFDATLKGKSMNGHTPAIEATFGCKEAYFANQQVNKKLDKLNFVGHFTNGEKRDLSTMKFTIEDLSARPEVGDVKVNLAVENFEEPNIDLKLNTKFKLDFLAKFLNVTDLKNMNGEVDLTMNFKDIIDLEHPEKSIEKLNESYYTQLKVTDLSFLYTKKDEVPLKDLDMFVKVDGHKAVIEYCNIKLGKSDLAIDGSISDLPAIIHHTDIPVDTRLNIKSKLIDIYELTKKDSGQGFDEQIENLSLALDFKSSAKAITESPNLPKGEFFIENLYAKLKHYPHAFHDFHADIFVESEDFKVVDFKGMIDKSDFFFSGKLKHYDLWFANEMNGDTRIDFNLISDHLRLEDIFAYKGENYVPEDYRHEQFDKLKVHGIADLHFKKELQSIDLMMDKFDAKMKIHPLRFEKFKGRVHYEKDHLVVEDFSGKLGKSDFKTTLHYYLGKEEALKKRENHFEIASNRLDFDELFNYNPSPNSANEQVDHDAGFNIYELPFTDMTYHLNIKHLNYHKYLIHNIKGELRTTPQHYIYMDKLNLDAAGGHLAINGYFNGSNPKLIYFSPDMKVKNVELDKLMLKFDNFGQDHMVSENLHGKFSGTITGKIHMHNDLVPKIDDSEIHIDAHVTEGRLEHFAVFDYMSDYFKDKNLTNVRFDTLDNKFDFINGKLIIPEMDINSSIGHMLVEGSQDMDMNMDYYIRVPWKMVTQTASSKLFKRKKEAVDTNQVDEIQYANENKKTRYVNIRVKGDADDYKVTLKKKKK